MNKGVIARAFKGFEPLGESRNSGVVAGVSKACNLGRLQQQKVLSLKACNSLFVAASRFPISSVSNRTKRFFRLSGYKVHNT